MASHDSLDDRLNGISNCLDSPTEETTNRSSITYTNTHTHTHVPLHMRILRNEHGHMYSHTYTDTYTYPDGHISNTLTEKTGR